MEGRFIKNEDGKYVEIDKTFVPVCMPNTEDQMSYLIENIAQLVMQVYSFQKEFIEYE